jgi:hypothetical protein
MATASVRTFPASVVARAAAAVLSTKAIAFSARSMALHRHALPVCAEVRADGSNRRGGPDRGGRCDQVEDTSWTVSRHPVTATGISLHNAARRVLVISDASGMPAVNTWWPNYYRLRGLPAFPLDGWRFLRPKFSVPVTTRACASAAALTAAPISPRHWAHGTIPRSDRVAEAKAARPSGQIAETW